MELDLPNVVDDKLLNLLKTQLNTDEQQQFILNFKLYLVYGDDDSKYVVDLEKIYEWLGYNRIDPAKRILVNNFTANEDYKVLLHTRVDQSRGGHNKEKILMNVSTFKELSMIANTEKAKKTRKYYSKMENIFFKYLRETHKEQILTLEQDNIKKVEIQKHNTLINSNKNEPLVYILKVSESDDKNFIVKLGETDDIQTRLISLKSDYPNCLFLDVFPCVQPHKFEQYLFNRRDIKKERIVNSELIQISEQFTYDNLYQIIIKNIDNFQGFTCDQKVKMNVIRFKSKLIDLIENTKDETLKNVYIETLKNVDNESKININKIEDEEDAEKNKIIESNRRVYKFDPSDLSNPIDIFYSLRDAVRSLNDSSIYDYHIRNACINNNIFNNFRWFMTDKNEDKPEKIPDTIEIKEKLKRNNGLVVQIDEKKEKILNVYPNITIAEKSSKIAGCQISIGISTKRKVHNFYWDLYENCDDKMKSTFKSDLPESIKISTSSKKVKRIDPITNEVLQKYDCIQDVVTLFRTSHKTINKLSISGDIYKGYIWKIYDGSEDEE